MVVLTNPLADDIVVTVPETGSVLDSMFAMAIQAGGEVLEDARSRWIMSLGARTRLEVETSALDDQPARLTKVHNARAERFWGVPIQVVN